MDKINLSETWIKASIAGAIWAASEIVLGSFLHNLKIPFSGNILTGIGIIVLIAISYTWRDKGLFWRAGVICAIMKTISPSAVIFGPILAILSEALLMELSIRLLGRTIIGFGMGAMLAMSWNLLQRVANLLLFYGLNIVEMYTDLIKLAQKQLNLQSDILWLPLIALLVAYCVMGMLSAFIGIRIGRKLLWQPKDAKIDTFRPTLVPRTDRSKPLFQYSLGWLFLDLFLLVAGLSVLNFGSPLAWASTIALIAVVWALRYKRALRQLSKPRFWLFFVVITMLASYLFSEVQGQDWREGLLIGLQMNFRAIVVVLGFAVLGTELYNPVIRAYFLKTSFQQLPAALELGFESLPIMIANIPDWKSLLKNPAGVIFQVILLGEERLAEISSRMQSYPKIYLVSGALAAGKTTFAKSVAELVRLQQIRTGGILSVRLLEHKETIGYDLQDLHSGEQFKFLRLGNGSIHNRIGRFTIDPDGLKRGVEILVNTIDQGKELVVIDEIGKLELRGEGWAAALQQLLALSECTLLLTVRKGMEQEMVDRWHLSDYQIVHVGITDPVYLAEKIAKSIKENQFR